MNPALLAMFARQAAPGQPMPSMTPPGMSAGMPPQGGPGMMAPGMPPTSIQPSPAGGGGEMIPAQAGMPPASMPRPTAPPPRPPQIDPSRVIRQVGNPQGNPAAARPMMQRGAAEGRGGDSMMAHMTPGEIVVPPEVQTPEVLAALNRAFAQMGANPTSYQAGHPDQKINPETGMPEFGFFDILLPLGLGLLGSAVGGPFIGSGLAGLGVGPTTAGILGGALGGAAGTTAGNLITGKPFGESLTRGLIGGAGSAIGGSIGSAFGGGPTAAAAVGPSAYGDVIGDVAVPAGGYGLGQTASAAAAPVAGASEFAKALERLVSPKSIGAGIGGLLGGSLADSLYQPGMPAPALDTPIPPPGSGWPLVGGGASRLTGAVNAGEPRFPGEEYLRKYGRRPQFNFFPTA